MILYRDFINTIVFQPNPNQNPDRTLPALFPPGDPNAGDPGAGRNTFLNENFKAGANCATCHFLPNGSDRGINSAVTLGQSQPLKTPQLRNLYQKRFFVRSATEVSLSGFGVTHDGGEPDSATFLSRPFFVMFAADTVRKKNLAAFMQCFDTGTAPAVGYTRTLTSATLAGSGADWSLLEAQAAASNSDLVIRLLENGERHGFVYRVATNDYLGDQTGLGPFTRAALEAKIAAGATLTVMGAPRTSGQRLGVDRDGDAILDADEPMPRLDLSFAANTPQLAWPVAEATLVLESSDSLSPPDWRPVTEPRTVSGPSVNVLDPAIPAQRFYRLRKP